MNGKGERDAGTNRYWLVMPGGGRQLIDPRQFDLERVAEQARRVGGRLEVEQAPRRLAPEAISQASGPATAFEPPLSVMELMFRRRLERIYLCEVAYRLELNARPTVRVLGGYYHKRKLVRVYTHDLSSGRRPTEELWDTFLHELAHHLEYTEPGSFASSRCQRVRGRMHSDLFWYILSILKQRWAELQHHGGERNWLTPE
jgi:hypothetical protein